MIDPDFSVYDLFHPQRSFNIFSERRRMLAYWCASIENTVARESLNTTIFAGFQELEYFLPVAKRYKRMVERGNTVYVFGCDRPGIDLPQIENLHYIPIAPDDQLRKEWFLIVNHPVYSRSLVAEEVTPSGTPHSERVFKGFMTSDLELIDKAHHELVNNVSS